MSMLPANAHRRLEAPLPAHEETAFNQILSRFKLTCRKCGGDNLQIDEDSTRYHYTYSTELTICCYDCEQNTVSVLL